MVEDEEARLRQEVAVAVIVPHKGNDLALGRREGSVPSRTADATQANAIALAAGEIQFEPLLGTFEYRCRVNSSGHLEGGVLDVAGVVVVGVDVLSTNDPVFDSIRFECLLGNNKRTNDALYSSSCVQVRMRDAFARIFWMRVSFIPSSFCARAVRWASSCTGREKKERKR